ncbi:flavin-containing monooxygenase [Ilumatobacter coccineus]|uniref:Baeyer-Villiger monooxygenase n=1 Tax=Ilumatobacter coccineus (strain NBRC 103263 / KCTC 29153 / YM16-304) TaxID=1313172 RepID=A0A6C7E8P9_ILUCY|nr:NAD(P)/FAD-dependent oxidoreductase [Ilumatobacter coccineus]BAN02402.1 Baeyer-Villiger monooxygenase [Ilumatobacter coccineus YM16-304]
MTATDLPFDPDALRAKYRAERDKRVRLDGNEQYLEVAGDYSDFVDDPYIESVLERSPLDDDTEVIVIGGGFGGLLAGARLRDAGISDIRLIEKGGDFGGTWYWNRYPGAMCDVESYVYLPLLEELDYVPTEKYVHAAEILEHSRAIGAHYDLYDNACFQTEVTGMRWDDDEARWIVSTNRGDEMRAKFVVMANGPLHRPKLPGIDGITDYTGHTFHTSRWDYHYTGGGPHGDLTGLRGKRVGIIGTGATAVQCVPHLGESADELYVFQRTPSSIDVRNNRPTDPDWAASLEPGWQTERMQNFNALVSGQPQPVDLVDDGWTDIIGKLLVRIQREGADADLSPEGIAASMELADFEKMEEIRRRAQEIVDDPDTAEALKPWYRQFCKRPCFHDDYLDTFNRPSVSLVDTDGRGIDRITAGGVVANGVEYEVDCIVFATGFEVGTDYSRRAGYEVTGRLGRTLTEKWADGMETLHGIVSHEFPNLFIMSPGQAGFTVSFPHLLGEQATHIAYIIDHALANDVDSVEVEPDAEAAWVQQVIDKSRVSLPFLESCTPGYYNNEGQPEKRAAQNSTYGGGSIEYFQILADWRADGSLPGLQLTR